MATQIGSHSQSYLINIETKAGKPQLSSPVEGFEDYGPLIKSSFYFEKVVLFIVLVGFVVIID